jgi:hypothetical protein
MRLTEYLILEARRNPEQNPKVSPLDQLTALHTKYPDAYVRFVDVPKLGANPRSVHGTPLGICAYPIEYVIQRGMKVPYAGEARYIVVFVTKPGAVLWNLGEVDVEDILPKIVKSTEGVTGVDLTQNLIYNTQSKNPRGIWSLMYNALSNVYNGGLAARKILTNAGLDGVVDPGEGIIFNREPFQSIFFNTKILHQVGLIDRRSNRGTIPDEAKSSIPALLHWFFGKMYTAEKGEPHTVLEILGRDMFGSTLSKTAAQVVNQALENNSPKGVISFMCPPLDARILVKYGLDLHKYNDVVGLDNNI